MKLKVGDETWLATLFITPPSPCRYPCFCPYIFPPYLDQYHRCLSSPPFPYILLISLILPLSVGKRWREAGNKHFQAGRDREAVSRFNASSLTLQHYRHIFSSSPSPPSSSYLHTIATITNWSPSYSSLPGSTRLWQQPLRNRGKGGI